MKNQTENTFSQFYNNVEFLVSFLEKMNIYLCICTGWEGENIKRKGQPKNGSNKLVLDE